MSVSENGALRGASRGTICFMTLRAADDAALYANHRRFLEAQRGPLTRHEGFDAIAGDTPFFQIAMLNDARAVEAAARTRPSIFAPPWARVEDDNAAVRRHAYQLTHMALAPGALGPAIPTTRLAATRARSEEDIRAFTEVQAIGFAATPDEAPALRDWFLSKNLGAAAHADQAFYILRDGGEPASVLLTVDTSDAVGIYAVATPPALRRRGLSTHLLQHVCAAAGERTVCLQAMRGGDAERLYAKLGFRERFVVDVWESALFMP